MGFRGGVLNAGARFQNDIPAFIAQIGGNGGVAIHPLIPSSTLSTRIFLKNALNSFLNNGLPSRPILLCSDTTFSVRH